jgi:iron(III) transport system ATP-binding protein
MTVYRNVEFPLRQTRNRVPRAERERRVMDALSLVQMEGLADRPAPFLSGGQQQRVALARALVSRPDVLLLDEPLSNLDAKLREELRVEVKELTKRLGMTAIYVTHDQVEALSMSDRIAVMHGGRILQEGTPRDIYLRPGNSFVAQFVGQVNFFEGIVTAGAKDGMGEVDTPQGRLRCVLPNGLAPGDAAVVAVRPESLSAGTVALDGGDGNVLEGEVEKAIFLGDTIDCQVRVGAQCIRARTSALEDLTPGKRVYIRFNPEACVVLRGEPVPRAAAQ